MSTITASGMHSDEFGKMMLVTQGLAGYTLVANKKILFRLFLDLTGICCPTVIAIVTYKHPPILGSSLTLTWTVVIPSGALLIEDAGSSFGPSIGVVFAGAVFPFVSPTGRYQVDFRVYGGWFAAHFRTPEMQFQAPGRLRILIHQLFGTAPCSGNRITPDISWRVDMLQSLERFSAMLPVRDGIGFGLIHASAGLCFTYGEDIDTWPPTPTNMVQLLLSETEQINATGTAGRVDATVGYRMRDVAQYPPPEGEAPGGQASYDPPVGNGVAFVVGGNLWGKEHTAPLLAQEVGHLFGLEPAESPHFEDPNFEKHSKNYKHDDPFAFDLCLLKHYGPRPPLFLGDVMNGTGGGIWQGRDMVLYNAFDWEYLRKRFVRLPGAARPLIKAKRPSKADQDRIAAALDQAFADDTKIDVRNPQKALRSRDGFTWHWTRFGFQLLKDEGKKPGPKLAPDAEMIRSSLEGLGIKEAYAPVADRPLRTVLTPNVYGSPHKEFGVL